MSIAFDALTPPWLFRLQDTSSSLEVQCNVIVGNYDILTKMIQCIIQFLQTRQRQSKGFSSIAVILPG